MSPSTLSLLPLSVLSSTADVVLAASKLILEVRHADHSLSIALSLSLGLGQAKTVLKLDWTSC